MLNPPLPSTTESPMGRSDVASGPGPLALPFSELFPVFQRPESPPRRDSLASLFPSEEEEKKGGCVGGHIRGQARRTTGSAWGRSLARGMPRPRRGKEAAGGSGQQGNLEASHMAFWHLTGHWLVRFLRSLGPVSTRPYCARWLLGIGRGPQRVTPHHLPRSRGSRGSGGPAGWL